MSYLFNSQIKELNLFATSIDNFQIKHEPMFFNSDIDFAYKHGNLITKQFIEALSENWLNKDLVFDSRIHMLMPNWYPCIPGYHHDDIYRPNNGQPDYDNLKYKSEHILGIVNADICPTSFALGTSSFDKVLTNDNIYKVWNLEVERQVQEKILKEFRTKDRTLYYFNHESWHKGTKAVDNGWRWFGRVSKNTDRTKHITNEIRTQVQVYLDTINEGW